MRIVLPRDVVELMTSLPIRWPTVFFRPSYRVGVERVAENGYRLVAPYTLYPEVGGWVLVTGINHASIRDCSLYTGIVLNTVLSEPGCHRINDASMVENIVAILKLKGYIAVNGEYLYRQPTSREDEIRNRVVTELARLIQR
jgi:hypothetical protein